MKTLRVYIALILSGMMLSTFPSVVLSCGMNESLNFLSGSADSSRGSARCGGDDDTDVRVALKLDTYKHKFYTIYARYRRNYPELKGKVVFGFDIEKNGTISNVKIINATTGNKDFLQDLLKMMRKVKFDPVRRTQTVYKYPLEFVHD